MEIAEIQADARELRTAQGWTSTDPVLRLAYLVTEVGEVAREVIELDQGAQHSVEARERLGMEIYDVVWNLCDLANLLSVDLESAFVKKAALNRQRNWSED
jgi:NTP pyrophosphatase (non-canonical NTP hydrolase)